MNLLFMPKKRKWPLFTCLLLFIATQAIAQTQNPIVSGTVISENGEALPGVTVQIENNDHKIVDSGITDEKGLFTTSALKLGEIYDFSFSSMGYQSTQIKSFAVKAGTNTLLARLKDNNEKLNEVVVVGYGTQQKRFVTGSVTKVSAEQLSNYSGSNFAQQLSGKAAGIQINEASGQPGSNPQIIIRGIGTLTAGRNPLIVVDGFPLTEGTSFNYINPNDIESLEVLKDPASASIYGSRAANGVILITTKKSKADMFNITIDAYTGFQQRSDKVEYVNAHDAAIFFTEARDQGYISKDPANRSITDDRATRVAKGASLRELRLNYLDPYLNNQTGLTDTNWTNEIFRTAPISNINVALSGGNGKTSYYTSFNAFNQEGLVVENGLKRYSASIKLNNKISDKAEFGVSLNPSYTIQRYYNESGGFDEPLGGVRAMYPFFKPYNDDGTLAISQQIKANQPEDGALVENPIAYLNMVKNNRTFFKLYGNAFINYSIINGLKYKFTLGGDFSQSMYDFYNPSNLGAYRTPAPKPATASETDGSLTNYLLEHTLTYSKKIDKHDFTLLTGYSYQKENSYSTIITGANIADDNIDNIGGASSFTVNANRYRWVQISYFSRLQYIFADKYIASFSYRMDGSSRFGADSRWGKFPSVTAGWIFSKEGFFPEQDVVSFGKLRATWGRSGNNQIGSYGSLGIVTGGNAANNYIWGNTPASGFSASTTPNINLSWETNTSYNLGLDLQLFRKIDITAEYYNATTSNLLLDVPVPQQSGFSSSLQNIGKVQNKGLDLSISASDIKLGQVRWNPGANISFNKNEVLALAPGQTQIISGSASNIITKVGGPIAELYGYQIMGVYKTQDQFNDPGTPKLPGTQMGDYIVKDVNGDGIIDTKDWTPMGTYSPKFTYGFSNSFAYKNFSLTFSLTGVEGRKVYETNLATFEEAGEGFSTPSKYYFENRYHPIDNPNGFFAQPNLGNFSAARRATKASNLYILDADYLRLRDVQLAYTLPSSIVKRAKIANMKIYIGGNNLFTITKYRGYNPETTSGSALTNGQATSNYPVARTIIFGTNITL
ncbi:TonB-dependent receptor [Flavobacterium sp. MDT1-60]|uniref:SusC/RagA family TonB-linked outer membrane protein n=1 Tax=Flavobacterium sp. MDT1-60 TaxID=1979344 RepID=UPI0017810431|nr:TonB-dependent receptor [Flavobacterium sp. MDT1-60]QOG01149.1 TonB-dependent receptor [Flavobacterium sp. MDT1-60]